MVAPNYSDFDDVGGSTPVWSLRCDWCWAEAMVPFSNDWCSRDTMRLLHSASSLSRMFTWRGAAAAAAAAAQTAAQTAHQQGDKAERSRHKHAHR